jgi:uncharacterized membrane protein YsdA (DUF1294 family)
MALDRWSVRSLGLCWDWPQTEENRMIWVLTWYILASVFTFAVYGLDKHKARTAKWRIKENTLHIMELLGGWPGGFVAQRYFHHKWKKTTYMVFFRGIVVLHIGLWAAVIWFRYYR